MTGEHNHRVQDFSKHISADQGMAARVLRMANSAYFAPTEPILDVDQAILYLGMTHLRTAVMSTRCVEQSCPVPNEQFHWGQFWVHAVTVACISRSLSQYLPDNQRQSIESYYIRGLFHDIGKLVFACLAPDQFVGVILESQSRSCQTTLIETHVFGVDHAALGSWYLQQQGLPPTVFESVRLHHAWNIHSRPDPNSLIIAMANVFAHEMRMGISGSVHPEITNAFETPEWITYESLCRPTEGIQHSDLRKEINQELHRIPDLVSSVVP